MKLPFTILAVLFILLGAPLGLMQYHSRAAFIESPAYPLLSTTPESQLTWHCIDELRSDLMDSSTTALDASIATVSDLRSYYEAQCAKWFTYLRKSQQTPGLVRATATAVAKSWMSWQPAFVTLPERLAGHYELHKAWRGRVEAYYLAAKKAAEVAAVNSLAKAIGGSVVNRLGALCDSHLPKWLADQLKPEPIPGLIATTAKAIGKSGAKWQLTLMALPERFYELRKREILAIWQQRCEHYAALRLKAAPLSGVFTRYETDHSRANDSPFIAETGDPAVIIASRTPLPAAATAALGTITSDLGIVATVPFGRAAADFISDLQSPSLGIATLAKPALWRPALMRAIDGFGRISGHNR